MDFVGSKNFTPDLLVHVLSSMHEHGEFLANNPGRGFTRDNHGLYEAEGVGVLSVLLVEFKQASVWRQNAFDLLARELVKQVRSDGVQQEGIASYQLATMRILTELPLLALKNGLTEFPSDYWARIKLMAQSLEVISYPNGDTPRFGDQVTRTNVNDAIRNWYAHFKLHRHAPHDPSSIALRPSGLFSLRSNWTANATMLQLRCGPSYNAHSHRDTASFTLFGNGVELMPDSGCFTYNGIKDLHPVDKSRRNFIGTAAHSTLTLEKKDAHLPSLISGPYRPVKGYDDCGVLRWDPGVSAGKTVLVVENHRTYQDPDGRHLSHRRAVLSVGPDAFVIVDEAIGNATGRVQTHFHLAPEMLLEPGKRHLSVVGTGPGPGALQVRRRGQGDPAIAASGGPAGATQEARKQQLKRPGALRERCRGLEAAVAASRSVAGALQERYGASNSDRISCIDQ